MFQEFLKQSLIKLKTTLPYRLIINNLILIVIAIVLLFLTIHSIIYSIFFGLFLMHLYKNNRLFFKITIIFIMITICSYYYHICRLPTEQNNIQSGKGKVVQIDYFEKYQKIYLKSNDGIIILYDDYHFSLKVGLIITFTGIPKKVYGKRVFKGFDYAKYLQRQKVVGIVNLKEIQIIEYKFDYRIIRQQIYNYLHKNFSKESFLFLQGILFGDTSFFDEIFYNSLIDIGVIHLFAISGLHIKLFISLLTNFLKKLKVHEKLINISVAGLLVFYLIITLWSPSILRASLMYLINRINKKYNLRLSSLDIVSLVFILLIIINPLYIYHYGFLMSFCVSIIIILCSPLVSHLSSLKQILVISVVTQILSFPIVVNLNSKYNLMSPFVNVLYILGVSSFILPFAIIVFIFPFLDFLFRLLVMIFSRLTILINENFSIFINFPKFTNIQTILYVGLIFSILKFYYNRKLQRYLIVLFIGLIFILSNTTFFKPYGSIYFLDLHNGESIVIQEPFNQCNVIIDTGDGKNNVVTNFLLNHGIKRIDYLILTHNHDDHNGEAEHIIQNFNVKNIVVHKYDNSYISRNYSTIRVQENNKITCGKLSFEVLNPANYNQDENDNSIVLFTIINNQKFLFTGDITKNIEKQLITKYKLEIDILKVAHHGSNTSTSLEFIKKTKPKYAIIMNGSVEKFNFPHPSVLHILQNNDVTTFTTKQYNSIEYRYFYNDKGIFYSVHGKI